MLTQRRDAQPKADKKYLTYAEFGERVGMSYEAVRRKVKAGEIRSVSFGQRQNRIAESEYERWVLSHIAKSSTPEGA